MPTAVDKERPGADIEALAFDLMREVNLESGTNVLMVTRDLQLTQRCDRGIDLVDGRLAHCVDAGWRPGPQPCPETPS